MWSSFWCFLFSFTCRCRRWFLNRFFLLWSYSTSSCRYFYIFCFLLCRRLFLFYRCTRSLLSSWLFLSFCSFLWWNAFICLLFFSFFFFFFFITFIGFLLPFLLAWRFFFF